MRFLALSFMTLGAVGAFATNLTFHGVADDFFDAYISTDDTVQGTLFASQTATWQSGGAGGTVALTAGVDNYLHVRARDVFGAPSMFIATASLSDSAFKFANQTQQINTNATDWQLSLTGFGQNYFAPTDLGKNGTLVWGNLALVDSNARHLWSQQTAGEHYFSLKIESVPEPLTLLALPAVLLLRRKKK
jgi:hypothetical protein